MFAAREQRTEIGGGVRGAATGAQDLDDTIDDLVAGVADEPAERRGVPAEREGRHLLRPRQRVELHRLVPQQPRDHRVPAVRDRRPDHAQERAARDPLPVGGGQARREIRHAGADARADGEADRPRDRGGEQGGERCPRERRRERGERRRLRRHAAGGALSHLRAAAADRHQRSEEPRRNGESFL